MKCPHCTKKSKTKVIASRQVEDEVWRMRLCGICIKQFVSRETTSVEMKFPWDEIQKLRRSVAAEEKPVQTANKWIFPTKKLW